MVTELPVALVLAVMKSGVFLRKASRAFDAVRNALMQYAMLHDSGGQLLSGTCISGLDVQWCMFTANTGLCSRQRRNTYR